MCFHHVVNHTYRFASGLSINHALGQPAQQSSTHNAAGLAVDGDFGTSAGTNKNDLYPYWTVDLQADVWVSSIALTNRDNMCELHRVLQALVVPMFTNIPTNQVFHQINLLEEVAADSLFQFLQSDAQYISPQVKF